MNLDTPLVIVGGGQAAAQMCESARRLGHRGPVTLVSEEPMLPYCRPPLSKQFLVTERTTDWLLYRPASFYARHNIETVLGRRVATIDRAGSQVLLDDGTALSYGGLGLALGARVRRLGIPGDEHVCYLRSVVDAQRLRGQLTQARSIVVIGGGFIGLEVAAVLVQTGVAVTLLVAGPRVLPRVAAPMAAFVQSRHAAAGVQLHTDCSIAEVRAVGAGGFEVVTTTGAVHRADLVLAGIGIVPNTELASAAGLDCDDGILVDACARTSAPDIAAAGDCTRHPSPADQRLVRLETVHNAIEQARSAAAALCGRDEPYRQTSWVWSDQYKLRFQFAGGADEVDETVQRGSAQAGAFSLFHFRAGRFIAFESVNRPMDFGYARRILNEGAALSSSQAADEALDLGTLLAPRHPLVFEDPWPAKALRRP